MPQQNLEHDRMFVYKTRCWQLGRVKAEQGRSYCEASREIGREGGLRVPGKAVKVERIE